MLMDMEGMHGFGHASPHEKVPRVLSTQAGGDRNLVQVELAKLAYPNVEHPMERWLEEYAETYSDYVEGDGCAFPHVDVGDPRALHELLEAVRDHRTVH